MNINRNSVNSNNDGISSNKNSVIENNELEIKIYGSASPQEIAAIEAVFAMLIKTGVPLVVPPASSIDRWARNGSLLRKPLSTGNGTWVRSIR